MSNPAANQTDVLLDRAARGDAAARSQLLNKHRSRLRRMVDVRLDRRLLPRIDPSDVVQEALADAAQKLSGYLRSRPVPFYPWLRRLGWEHLVRLQKLHMNTRRRSVLREVCSIRNLPDESAVQLIERLAAADLMPDRRLLAAELKSRVHSALAQLPERDHELLVLRYLEHLSNAEIAELWNMSDGAVRTAHTRAVAKLAKLMKCQDRE